MNFTCWRSATHSYLRVISILASAQTIGLARFSGKKLVRGYEEFPPRGEEDLEKKAVKESQQNLQCSSEEDRKGETLKVQ